MPKSELQDFSVLRKSWETVSITNQSRIQQAFDRTDFQTRQTDQSAHKWTEAREFWSKHSEGFSDSNRTELMELGQPIIIVERPDNLWMGCSIAKLDRSLEIGSLGRFLGVSFQSGKIKTQRQKTIRKSEWNPAHTFTEFCFGKWFLFVTYCLLSVGALQSSSYLYKIGNLSRIFTFSELQSVSSVS